MEEEIVCNRERDLADERITITNIKISSSSFVISFLGLKIVFFFLVFVFLDVVRRSYYN